MKKDLEVDKQRLGGKASNLPEFSPFGVIEYLRAAEEACKRTSGVDRNTKKFEAIF